MNRAVFLDRDGVINRKAPEGEYITSWEQMEILPGAGMAIARLNDAGFRIIVVTNQRAIARGLLTIPRLEAMHRQMCDKLASDGAKIDDIYYCPHDLEPGCECRKPEPGMLLDAARRHDIDLAVSWMVGDSSKDVEAGKRAGCRTARLLADKGESAGAADLCAPSLLAISQKILELEKYLPRTQPVRTARTRDARVSSPE